MSRGTKVRPSWILGLAFLGAVIVVALRFSEVRELAAIAERARPAWLLAALALQAGTYLAEGAIWWNVARAARAALPLPTAFQLSLAKLFVDQALPSAGLSGTVIVARALEQRGLPRPVVMAGVVVHTASYYGAYVLSLGVAMLVMLARGQVNPWLALLSVGFGVFAAAITTAVLALPGRGSAPEARLSWVRPLRGMVTLVKGADPALARDPPLLLQTGACHIAIVLLDAATLWVLIGALGASAPPAGVFAAFMVASLFRTVGVIPSGLGTFDAAAIVALRTIGVPIAVGLAATLLFRLFSFWLPMLPGMWASRRVEGVRAVERPALDLEAWWSVEPAELFRRLGSSPGGLSSEAAADRLREHGRNELREEQRLSRLRVLWNQVRSPLLLLLVFAALASLLSGEWTDAAIVLAIVVATVGVGYTREHSAQRAVAELRARVKTLAKVQRDGAQRQVPVEEVVPGDIVTLAAGSLVPADGVLLEATDCYVSEGVLTGESFPVEKACGPAPAATPLARRANCVYMGTNVRSGTARALIVATGPATEFGHIAHRLTLKPPETEFDRGVRRFGYFLTIAMLVMVLIVFVVHVLNGRPPLETLLFAIALAVGLSPELLPAILTINLARGARVMAANGVLVRHLNAIENLGSMDVLCTDKTGTLTEGVVQVEGAYDAQGAPAPPVLELAAVNAALETGLPSPLDDAILAARRPDLSALEKRAEVPFDFVRKRVSVVVGDPQGSRLVTKGAVANVLEVCDRLGDGRALDGSLREELQRRVDDWGREGTRVLGVASRRLPEGATFDRAAERGLTFEGFVTFLDRPKEDVPQALVALAQLGVSVKIITGDNRLVAQHVATMVGLAAPHVLTGEQLDALNDDALWHAAERTELFVEVDPRQKERIIRALQKTGHVVGFLGDGVNDAPSMHAADTSLSVEQAVDVARAAADFVLLERDLDVIRRGIEEGRRTFANTLKYLLTTTSANLGNMLSMAGASLFLPFLPLLAGQVLLLNFIADIPAIGIADDTVDPELVSRPRRWDLRFIGRFMIEFGTLSSVFDFLTFGALLVVFRAGPELFRTGWFVESLLTSLTVALIVRTRRPFFRSRPGNLLFGLTLALIPMVMAIPFLPHIHVFGFVPVPFALLASLVGVTVLYAGSAEVLKWWFYRHRA